MSLARHVSALTNGAGEHSSFEFIGARLPRIRNTVVVSEAFRSSVLSALHIASGRKDSFLLSGHTASGIPDKTHHHAYYLPRIGPEDRVVGLDVVSPFQKFSEDERRALGLIRTIQWEGPSTRLSVSPIDAEATPLTQVATIWRSVTPYVPPRRYWGTHGKRHLTPDKQLTNEMNRILELHCEVLKLESYSGGKIRVRVARSTLGTQPGPCVLRQGYRVTFKTAAPICGPLALGHSAHFGLGQFIPDETHNT